MMNVIRCPKCSRVVRSAHEQMMWWRSVSYDEYDRYLGHGLSCLNDLSGVKCPCGHDWVFGPCLPLATA